MLEWRVWGMSSKGHMCAITWHILSLSPLLSPALQVKWRRGKYVNISSCYPPSLRGLSKILVFGSKYLAQKLTILARVVQTLNKPHPVGHAFKSIVRDSARKNLANLGDNKIYLLWCFFCQNICSLNVYLDLSNLNFPPGSKWPQQIEPRNFSWAFRATIFGNTNQA